MDVPYLRREHSRFGAGGPNRRPTRSHGRGLRPDQRSSPCVPYRGWPEQAEFSDQPLHGACGHWDALAVQRQPHFASTVDAVVGGVDPRDLALEVLAARLPFADNGMAEAWLSLSAMQGDEVQKQVAEVANALYRRTDEPAVLHARAITRVRGRRR
jgi:hypothetical protein